MVKKAMSEARRGLSTLFFLGQETVDDVEETCEDLTADIDTDKPPSASASVESEQSSVSPSPTQPTIVSFQRARESHKTSE